MTNSKMTYVDALTSVLTSADMTDEVREKLEALKTSLINRAEKRSDKPSKQKTANDATKVRLGELLGEADHPLTVDELLAGLADEAMTSHRVAALMGQMVKDGIANRVEGKGKNRKVSYTVA